MSNLRKCTFCCCVAFPLYVNLIKFIVLFKSSILLLIFCLISIVFIERKVWKSALNC